MFNNPSKQNGGFTRAQTTMKINTSREAAEMLEGRGSTGEPGQRPNPGGQNKTNVKINVITSVSTSVSR